VARARNIKPGFFVNEELAQCDPLARLLFAGLWCWADRDGRLEERVMRIKAQVLPYDDCNIATLLTQLATHKFIVRYQVDNRNYIQIANFHKHQNPHVKEHASTIPAPDLSDTKTADSLILDSLTPITESLDSCQPSWHNTLTGSGTACDPTATEPTEKGYPQAFEDFWEIYPNRGGRKRGKKNAFSLWKLVPAANRQMVVLAATNYAASREAIEGFARDPERFLKSEWWRDWVEIAQPASISRVPTDEDLANWNPSNGGGLGT
jgi:hypothetical protein